MRRYSSFFPFVPRPSAFRAPGGGYFVQVREGDCTPFGIAVDPGPDFLENLYRCGYALADIQMVIVTHDHADHLATLDALLAVIYYRDRLATDPSERFSRDDKRCLLIVGNESVKRRYSFFNEEGRKDAVKVLTFGEVDEITRPDNSADRMTDIEGEKIVLEPETLWIEPVRTWGHRDANGFIAQGFLLHFGPGAAHDHTSILFTADTGAPGDLATPPDPDRLGRDHLHADGAKSLRAAVEEADIVVAHLSSVPLQEVRQFAGMVGGGANDLGSDLVDQYEELWERATEEAVSSEGEADGGLRAGIADAEFLLKQIQFGFRVRPLEEVKEEVSVSPFSSDQKGSPPLSHLYLRGLMEIAEVMAQAGRPRGPLLLLGELREELGTFRTSIATSISKAVFDETEEPARPKALTADIGLRVRLRRDEGDGDAAIDVLCTTCDLDNDLVPSERFHGPGEISEICVKGEDEGVFYNCWLHDPRMRDEYLWVEAVERYDVFGE